VGANAAGPAVPEEQGNAAWVAAFLDMPTVPAAHIVRVRRVRLDRREQDGPSQHGARGRRQCTATGTISCSITAAAASATSGARPIWRPSAPKIATAL
jgi:hypothetical protein